MITEGSIARPGNKGESICEGCGKPATRLAKSAANGVELAKAPKLGACCNEKLRPAGLNALTFLVEAS